MAPRRRHLLLAGALALTLAAVFLVPEDETPAPAQRPAKQAAPAGGAPSPSPPVGEVTRADLTRRPYAAGDGDLFPAHSWAPPPPAPTAEAAAPAGPPPLPFAYIGKMEEKRGTVVFLLQDERTLAVRSGDVIDGTWRVAAVTPLSLELVYLPSKQQQSLNLGSADK